MTFKHKLSRRLAALYVVLVASVAAVAGCADTPTGVSDEIPMRSPDADPALALTADVGPGVRIITDRWVQVFAEPSRKGKVIGKQRDRVLGSIVEGPTAVTLREPYPLWRVDFDSGADGWVLGAYLSLLVSPAPTPTPTPVAPRPVASVSVSPASASLNVGDTVSVLATLRDSSGTVLTGRTVTWSSNNSAVASVSASGLVFAASGGSATITVTSEGRSATAAISVAVPTPVAPAPIPPPTTAPGTTGTPYWASAWNSATGTSSTAFLDLDNINKWGFFCCSGNTNTSIASAASLGLVKWPVANVYRVGVQASAPGMIHTHQIESDIGEPAAGSHRYFRYYLQVTYGDNHGAATEGNVEHGVETAAIGGGGGDGMNFFRIPNNDGTWWPGYREIATGLRFTAAGLRLRKNHTYRLEWHLAYGTNTYTVEIRIYNEDGVLVATEADFRQILPSTNSTILLTGAQFTYSAPNHRMLRVGTNGPSSNFPMQNITDENLFLHGAVAVCSTGWCGPHTP